MRSFPTSCENDRSAMIASFGYQRQCANRTSGAVFYFKWRAENHRPRRRQKIEVREALQAVAPRPVHVVVAGVRGRQVMALPCVGSNRFRAESGHVALLDEETNGGGGRARRVLSGLVVVLIRERIGALRPIGAHQHPGTWWDAPV